MPILCVIPILSHRDLKIFVNRNKLINPVKLPSNQMPNVIIFPVYFLDVFRIFHIKTQNGFSQKLSIHEFIKGYTSSSFLALKLFAVYLESFWYK